MISRPTVFVLGAGASMPYSFPSGVQLASQIATQLTERNGELSRLMRANGIDDKLLQAFPIAFRESGRESLDAFVQSRREFLSIVKLAIVISIGLIESEPSLFTSGADWMKYLFNRMAGGSPGDFASNQLKVITFNFERSFERRMFLNMRANYDMDDVSALTSCETTVPVLHFHGDLGEPGWGAATITPTTRDYRPLNQQQSLEEVSGFAERIKLIHEEIPKTTIETAQKWMLEAERVCFIGFGYHRLNLDRLQARHLGTVGGRSREVAGTFVGHERGEIDAVKTLFAKHIQEYRCDALQFLRETHYAQG